MDNKYQKYVPLEMSIEELMELEKSIDMNDIYNEKILEMYQADPN